MSAPIDQSNGNTALNWVPADSKLLRLLVVVHLLLGLAPIATVLLPLDDIRFRPLIFAFLSVPYSQVMLLSFWVGMGTSDVIWRLLGAMMGSAYLAASLVFFSILLPDAPQTSTAERILRYETAFAICCTSVLVFAGGFWRMRRFYSELCRIPDPRVCTRPRFQYSIRHLLLLMTFAAIVLGLTRMMRSARSVTEEQVSFTILGLMVFVTNSFCAVRATLEAGRIGLPVFLVYVLAVLLAAALGIAIQCDKFAWWVFLGCVLAMSVPTIIVILSLLVVRSCGYRLIRKRRAMAEDDESQSSPA